MWPQRFTARRLSEGIFPLLRIDSSAAVTPLAEVIEAHELYGTPYDLIDVVVHPQSVVHSMVEFVDGSQKAQLGLPDMRIPIQYSLTSPQRTAGPAPRLDLTQYDEMTFEAPDLDRFPCLRLARQAGQAGQAATIVLNAANEVAVAALLQGRITYADIPRVVESTLAAEPVVNIDCLTTALAVDEKARATADGLVAALPEPGS